MLSLWRLALIAVTVIGAVALAEVLTLRGGGNTIGKPAPALPAQVLVGPRVDLSSLRGKPALVTFWASWCGPCKREAPELERLSHLLDGSAHFVGVDWGDDASSARAFVGRHGWTFPNLRDESNAVGNRFGLIGLPTTFVLDSRGRIAARLPGPQTTRSLQGALRSVH